MLSRKKNGLHFTVLNSEQGRDEEEITSVGGKYWKANGFFSESFADRKRQRKRKKFAGFRRGESHHRHGVYSIWLSPGLLIKKQMEKERTKKIINTVTFCQRYRPGIIPYVVVHPPPPTPLSCSRISETPEKPWPNQLSDEASLYNTSWVVKNPWSQQELWHGKGGNNSDFKEMSVA